MLTPRSNAKLMSVTTISTLFDDVILYTKKVVTNVTTTFYDFFISRIAWIDNLTSKIAHKNNPKYAAVFK